MKTAKFIRARMSTTLALTGTIILALSLSSSPVNAVDVLTDMNDNNRSGANTSETILNPSNVNVNQFGKLWTYSVKGAAYASPLYVSDVTINGASHNVVFIETMEDDVYAFDADSDDLLWSVSFVGGDITPVPITDITGNNGLNIVGDVGIESTPYIDKAGGTIYVLARTKNTSNNTHAQTLHALDITTGAEKFGGPVVIPQANGFSALMQNQRAGLARAGDNIIICWGSHEDITPYHGFMMAYNATTLAQAGIYNVTGSGSQGAIWMQGRAPAVDASGNIYVITSNGTWDGSQNFSESFLKLNSSLSLLDWFTPDNYNTLTAGDEDLGSGGALLIPNTSLVMGGGKQGTVFLLNTGNMGHEKSGNGQVVQQITGFASGEIHGGPVYWDSAVNGSLIFDWAAGDHLKSFKFNGSTLGTSPFQTSSASAGGSPGGFLSISSDGNNNGIVWASVETVDSDHGTVPGIVRAYNADNIGGPELWDSNENSSRDSSGTFVKDANPLVANGRVYVPSYNGSVAVYGLLAGNANNLLVNPSFETNTSGAVFTTKVYGGFDVAGNDVAGWLDAGATYVNSGVDFAGDAKNNAENGTVLVFAKAGDSGAYQITGYQMQSGVELTLTWWAKASTGAAAQSVSLLSATSTTSAFSSLTTLATSTAALTDTGDSGAYTQYTLTYTPTAADAGHYAAVAFKTAATPAGAWATFDNFSLTVPTSGTVANGTYNVINRASGLALDNKGLTTNGSPVGLWTLDASPNLQWVVTLQSDGYYKLAAVTGGLYLDSLGGTTNGSPAGQWSGNPSDNQEWSFVAAGSYYKLVNHTSGLRLDSLGGTTNGAPVGQWSDSVNYNQQWSFVVP